MSRLAKVMTVAAIAASSSFACGCLDWGTARSLANVAKANYRTGDAAILAQISAIGGLLKDAYDNLENTNAKNIETSLRLKNEMTRTQKEIHFNRVLINRLDSLFIDGISIKAHNGANGEIAK